MSNNNNLTCLRGDILDHAVFLEQSDFQRICQISEKFLLELIEEGVIEPEPNQDSNYFSGVHIQRVRKAYRLNCDLGVNLPGIALILELLEKIDHLEKHY